MVPLASRWRLWSWHVSGLPGAARPLACNLPELAAPERRVEGGKQSGSEARAPDRRGRLDQHVAHILARGQQLILQQLLLHTHKARFLLRERASDWSVPLLSAPRESL